jgi:arylsulfatase A-like enzyme
MHGFLVQLSALVAVPESEPLRGVLLIGFYLSVGTLGGAIVGMAVQRRASRLAASERPRAARNRLISHLLVAGLVAQLLTVMATKLVGMHRGLGLKKTLLMVAAAGVLILFGALARPRLATAIRKPYLFFFLTAFGISALVVVGTLLNDQFLPGLLSPLSLVGNLALLAVLAVLLVPGMLNCMADMFRWQFPNAVVQVPLIALGFLVLFSATLTARPRILDEGFAGQGSAAIDTETTGSFQNIILIVIDTLRADHLSLYGYDRPTSPHLEELGEDSVVYRNAVSPSSWTLPAHASIFTGLYPSRHGAHFTERADNLEGDLPETRRDSLSPTWPLPESARTLAEILNDDGYRTAAAVANYSFLYPAFGLSQGFDHYQDRMRETRFFDSLLFYNAARWFLYEDYVYQVGRKYRSAAEINRSALWFLDRAGTGPFFLFLNYMEPHAPYLPPSGYRDRFSGRQPAYSGNDPEILAGERDLSDADRDHLVSQYDGEIASLDQELGRLFRGLKERGLYDSTLIIVTSDHGEFFGEHRLLYHACGLYEEVLRVPLIVKYPESNRTGIRDEPVSTIDIMPTVLAETSGRIPDGLDGRPLGAPPRPVFSEQFVSQQMVELYGDRFNRLERSVRSGRFKMIVRSDGSRELFDLATDPSEADDLTDLLPDRAAELLRGLKWRFPPSSDPMLPAPDLDPEAIERLRSLGYL